MNACVVAIAATPLLAVATAYVVLSLAIGIRSQRLRALLLHVVARCRGVRLQWVTDPTVALQVLRSSGDKGDLIETLLSAPAWRPIVSLEAVNGDQWQRMRVRFAQLIKALPPLAKLTTIVEAHSRALLHAGGLVDARNVTALSVASFFEWVFEREMDHEALPAVCQATWEWRKQLALKGVADERVKQRLLEWFEAEIRRTPKLYELFGEQWVTPECYSLILQPFVISPAINLTDIAVAVKLWTKTAPVTESITPEIIRQCVCSAHPFPVIERYFPNGDVAIGVAPNTHVLIPLDEMAGAAFAAGVDLSFGAGARICAGRHMAMKAMTGLFTDSLVRSDRFQPELGHKYSGRHNDGKETMSETIYQLQFAVRIVGSAVVHRLARLCKKWESR